MTLQSLMHFYKTIFNRNSIDNVGMGLIVSIGFANDYCNAYWNGAQLILGDGDGAAFGDFALCEDVLAHEVAHAVTQYTIGLSYVAEAGALNESLSDVFAVVFCQWRRHQSAERADWKLGSGVIGAELRQRGYRALRSLQAPDAAGVLLPQPRHMRDYDPNDDPHINCGIPNHAFYKAAMALGGNSWDRIVLIWYSALSSGRRSPNMTFAEFAKLTIHRATMLFRSNAAVPRAVEQAWKDVGVL
jgi:Zn-dependent metalloprotease